MPQTVSANTTLYGKPDTNTGQADRVANGTYSLVMQDDGNLVLYEGTNPLWSTGTNGAGAVRAILQGDGNLVLYSETDAAVWASGTDGHDGATLVLQDDGNLVLLDASGSQLWATNTQGTGQPQIQPIPSDAQAAPEVSSPAQPEPAAPAPQPRTYTVQPGDSLWAIANQNGYDSWQPIYDANRGTIGDNPDAIQPGMVLTLP